MTRKYKVDTIDLGNRRFILVAIYVLMVHVRKIK